MLIHCQNTTMALCQFRARQKVLTIPYAFMPLAHTIPPVYLHQVVVLNLRMFLILLIGCTSNEPGLVAPGISIELGKWHDFVCTSILWSRHISSEKALACKRPPARRARFYKISFPGAFLSATCWECEYTVMSVSQWKRLIIYHAT